MCLCAYACASCGAIRLSLGRQWWDRVGALSSRHHKTPAMSDHRLPPLPQASDGFSPLQPAGGWPVGACGLLLLPGGGAGAPSSASLVDDADGKLQEELRKGVDRNREFNNGYQRKKERKGCLLLLRTRKFHLVYMYLGVFSSRITYIHKCIIHANTHTCAHTCTHTHTCTQSFFLRIAKIFFFFC